MHGPMNVKALILIMFLICTHYSLITDAVDTVICAPDDGWRSHPKHVEQFTDKINCV